MNTFPNIISYSRLQKKVIDFALEKIERFCPSTNKSLHCAVIVYKGLIITFGTNNERANHNFAIGFQKKSIHAEWQALRRLWKMGMINDIYRMDMYSIRVTRHSKLANAKPCRLCMNTIEKNKPRKVYYTNDLGLFDYL